MHVTVMGHHHIPLARSSPPQSYPLVPPVFVDPFLATPPTSTLSYPVPPSHRSNDGGFILALVLLVLILVALFVWAFFHPCKQWLRTTFSRGAKGGFVCHVEFSKRNASTTYNILNEEGRIVAAALLPYGVSS
uniref:Uncharacterized protein n=1 Tax=Quercus lobata TaxID=97700 RepID=A0A7N2LD76_QUELO